MMKKRTLGFWEIWNMSFGLLAIQIDFALQNANVSPIFQTLDAKTSDSPILCFDKFDHSAHYWRCSK